MCTQPLTFWFSSHDRFPELFEHAPRYLSVPGNSVDAERSVSRYALVNAPQRKRKNFTDQNLALHAMMVFTGSQHIPRSAVYAVTRCPSVCLSVCHVRGSRQNE